MTTRKRAYLFFCKVLHWHSVDNLRPYLLQNAFSAVRRGTNETTSEARFTFSVATRHFVSELTERGPKLRRPSYLPSNAPMSGAGVRST